MIVRISGEDQYRLAAQDGQLNKLDNAVVAAVESHDEQAFQESYASLLEYVRSHGERLSDEDLEGSDLILPPSDLTLAEASSDFTGEGLIPD